MKKYLERLNDLYEKINSSSASSQDLSEIQGAQAQLLDRIERVKNTISVIEI